AKPEDRQRAASIRKAIDLASTSGVDTRFDRLIGLLKKNKDLNLEEVTEAMNDTKMLVTDIRAILALLLSDNRDERLKAERERLAELIKRLDKAIRDEKTTRAQTESGRAEKRDLVDQERKNRKQVADIGKALEKKDDDKQEQGGQQGQQGQQQQGDQQDEQKQQDNPNDPTPGQKQIQDAQKYQRQAEDNLEKEKREDASKQQSKAIEELEKARKK